MDYDLMYFNSIKNKDYDTFIKLFGICGYFIHLKYSDKYSTFGTIYVALKYQNYEVVCYLITRDLRNNQLYNISNVIDPISFSKTAYSIFNDSVVASCFLLKTQKVCYYTQSYISSISHISKYSIISSAKKCLMILLDNTFIIYKIKNDIEEEIL